MDPISGERLYLSEIVPSGPEAAKNPDQLRHRYAQDGATTWEKDTKTHQQRRIALDENTVALPRAQRRSCDEVATALGASMPPSAFVSSPGPDQASWVVPSSVTRRISTTRA